MSVVTGKDHTGSGSKLAEKKPAFKQRGVGPAAEKKSGQPASRPSLLLVDSKRLGSSCPGTGAKSV